MNDHVELHFCPTPADAARLQYAGLPRYDLEPGECGNCGTQVGERMLSDNVAFWKPLAVVVWENGLDVLCFSCSKGVRLVVDKTGANR